MCLNVLLNSCATFSVTLEQQQQQKKKKGYFSSVSLPGAIPLLVYKCLGQEVGMNWKLEWELNFQKQDHFVSM